MSTGSRIDHDERRGLPISFCSSINDWMRFPPAPWLQEAARTAFWLPKNLRRRAMVGLETGRECPRGCALAMPSPSRVPHTGDAPTGHAANAVRPSPRARSTTARSALCAGPPSWPHQA
jgi:hypothetical protein